MTPSSAARIMCLLLVLVVGSGAFRPQQTPSLERLWWMAGCWELRSGDRLVEEQWMTPRGQLMLGMSRTTVAGVLREYEQVMILEDSLGIVYRAAPSGQAPAEFRAVEITDSSAIFANPGHDFPQRIGYRATAGGDSLRAWIDGLIDGRERAVEFPYARKACGRG